MSAIYRRSSRLNNKYTHENKKRVINVIAYIKLYLKLIDYYNYSIRRIFYYEKLTKYLLCNIDIIYLHYNLIGNNWGPYILAKIINKKYKETLFDITKLYNNNLLTKQKSQHLTTITTKVINVNKNYLFSRTKYLFKTILPNDIIREIITKWL